MRRNRVVVIGGGIAGISAAYWLAQDDSKPLVTLIEQEKTLKYHTSGRSVAQLALGDGHPSLKPLTQESLEFFKSPPQGCDPLLKHRPHLYLALNKNDDNDIERLLNTRDDTNEIEISEAQNIFPYLIPESIHRAILVNSTYEIEVDTLYGFFKRSFLSAGGEIAIATRMDAARETTSSEGNWVVETTKGDLAADTIVNAAGPWGDVVARRAGIESVNLQCFRRTVFRVETGWGEEVNKPQLPYIGRATEKHWYAKPHGNFLLCSLSEEEPSEPCDAKPRIPDIELAKQRIEQALNIEIDLETAFKNSWVGLRTFTSDRQLIIKKDLQNPNFIWYVGQGGVGIQLAPAAGRLVAEIALS